LFIRADPELRNITTDRECKPAYCEVKDNTFSGGSFLRGMVMGQFPSDWQAVWRDVVENNTAVTPVVAPNQPPDEAAIVALRADSDTPSMLSLAGAPVACVDDEGCSLNGRCSSGRCVCDAPWGGAEGDCGCLMPEAAQPVQGYGIRPNITSWGGSVVWHGAAYHMWVTEEVGGCGMDSHGRVCHLSMSLSDNPNLNALNDICSRMYL
jgi:hypothetical protein